MSHRRAEDGASSRIACWERVTPISLKAGHEHKNNNGSRAHVAAAENEHANFPLTNNKGSYVHGVSGGGCVDPLAARVRDGAIVKFQQIPSKWW